MKIIKTNWVNNKMKTKCSDTQNTTQTTADSQSTGRFKVSRIKEREKIAKEKEERRQ